MKIELYCTAHTVINYNILLHIVFHILLSPLCVIFTPGSLICLPYNQFNVHTTHTHTHIHKVHKRTHDFVCLCARNHSNGFNNNNEWSIKPTKKKPNGRINYMYGLDFIAGAVVVVVVGLLATKWNKNSNITLAKSDVFYWWKKTSNENEMKLARHMFLNNKLGPTTASTHPYIHSNLVNRNRHDSGYANDRSFLGRTVHVHVFCV